VPLEPERNIADLGSRNGGQHRIGQVKKEIKSLGPVELGWGV
jgi:hypothetical protein